MRFLHANDKLATHADSWYASTSSNDPYQQLENDQTTDVCIVGGGYTGLSAALHLAKAGVRVVLLEAHRVGWGASGRNGGQLGSGFNGQETLAKKIGLDKARVLWNIAEAAKHTVHTVCEEFAIDCEYRNGLIHAFKGKNAEKHARHWAELARADYGSSAFTALGRAEMQNYLGSSFYQAGLVDNSAGHLHPLKLAAGIALAAKTKGAEIFERSEATTIQVNGGGDYPVCVTTSTARVKAKKMILACNGYLDNLHSEVARYVFPINNFIVATEPLHDLADELLPGNHAVADDRYVVNYFHLSPDKRLIFGGGETYSSKFPNNTETRVRRAMLRIFPQLEDTRIDYSWGGTLAVTANRLPFVKKFDERLYAAGGYSGHGVALANQTGKLIAEDIVQDSQDFETLAGLSHQRFPKNRYVRSAVLGGSMMLAATIDRF